MGTEIGAQFDALLKSLLLGMGLAMLYDALRAVRLKRRTRRALTDLLDTLYCLALAVISFSFALRIGGGELRLYMLFAAIAGAMISFALFSPFLRPLWSFWADTLFAFLQLLSFPLKMLKNFSNKAHKFSKKLFLFSRNSLIIENYRWAARRARRHYEKREGLSHGQTTQTSQQHFRRAVHFRTFNSDRRASSDPAAKD